jgi:hypothetical protein
MAARVGRVVCIIAALALLFAAHAQQPACNMPQIVQQLQEASATYSALVTEINPRYLPRDMDGYDEAADRLERLGAELERISRKALQTDPENPVEVAALGLEVRRLQGGMADLRAFATPLRAYAYMVRNDYNRPRWAFSQAPAAEFVPPDLRSFDDDFTDTVEITAAPGEHAALQLIAIPIREEIRRPEVQLPEELEGEETDIDPFRIRCGQAATRSSPLAEDEREYPDCPYRLRECDPGHTIAEDRVQPFWFTLRVPPDAQPGDYDGELTFSADDIHDVKLELILTVPDADSEPAEE